MSYVLLLVALRLLLAKSLSFKTAKLEDTYNSVQFFEVKDRRKITNQRV